MQNLSVYAPNTLARVLGTPSDVEVCGFVEEISIQENRVTYKITTVSAGGDEKSYWRSEAGLDFIEPHPEKIQIGYKIPECAKA